MSLAGRRPSAGLGEEALHEEGLEALLELRGDGLRDFVGRALPVDPIALAPTLEVGVALRRVFPHGEGVDQVLELLRELVASRPVGVGGFDQRRDLLPVDDAVAGHLRCRTFYRKVTRLLDKGVPHPYALSRRVSHDRRQDGGQGGADLYPPA